MVFVLFAMKRFEIDVSGEDLLSKNYTICISDGIEIIKGFKFGEDLVKVLCSRYGQGLYRYKKSKHGLASFKVRLYCVTIYYLFRSFNIQEGVSLRICRDFDGRENHIKKMLDDFLREKLKINLSDSIYFEKLSSESFAHKYAGLMRQDIRNQMNNYIKITLEDFERWLK